MPLKVTAFNHNQDDDASLARLVSIYTTALTSSLGGIEPAALAYVRYRRLHNQYGTVPLPAEALDDDRAAVNAVIEAEQAAWQAVARLLGLSAEADPEVLPYFSIEVC